MKTLALTSKDFKEVIDQVRSGEVSLFIDLVKGELTIDGQVLPPGSYQIPTDVELIDELVRHYEIRERLGRKQSFAPLPSDWAGNCSGPFRITHLSNTRGKPILIKLELMLDRIQYGQYKPSPHAHLQPKPRYLTPYSCNKWGNKYTTC